MTKDGLYDKRISGRDRYLTSFSGRERPRRSASRTIGVFIPELTRPAFQRKSPLFVRLVMDWENFVGPRLAGQSEPRRIRGGVLVVACCGPVAIEMQYAAPQILERINIACGLQETYRLHELKLTQDHTIKPPAPRRCQAELKPVSVPDMKKGPLRAVLERLGGHIAARSQETRSREKG